MPEFVNPFSGMAPGRKMTLNELIRALRLNLAAEEEAVHLYQAHADATDNELAKAVLLDIADEERVHAGEFQRLINLLVEDEAELLAEGAAEVDAEAAKLSSKSAAEGVEPGKQDDDTTTIGSLRE
jgi:rubrerythrin